MKAMAMVAKTKMDLSIYTNNLPRNAYLSE